MDPRRAASLAFLVLAACSGGGGGTVANRPASSKETLEQMLVREVGAGAQVAILAGPKGLRAVSADGLRTRVLAPTARWTLVDNRSHVVWFGSDASTVFAIDLEASAAAGPAVIKVATGLPESSGAGAPLVAIDYQPPKGEPALPFGSLQYGGRLQPRVVISLGREPALTVEGGILDMWSQTDEFAAEVKKATLLERAWLARVYERGRDGAFSLFQPSSGTLRVPGVDTKPCDNDPDRCGTAEAIPGTKLWRVAISFSCGDGCYTDWRLYDPAAKAFLQLHEDTPVSDAWVARDGSAFVMSGNIWRFDRAPFPDQPRTEGEGGGWLGGAYHLY